MDRNTALMKPVITLGNKTLNVLTWIYQPFFYPCAMGKSKSRCKLRGYGAEFMEAIGQLCRVNYELIDGTNITLGTVFANGTITPGFYTILRSGRADLTPPGMSINVARLDFGLMSLPFPFWTDFETYQYRNPSSASGTLTISINYFSQFKIDIWIFIVVSILVAFATYYFFTQNKRAVLTFVRTFELIFPGEGLPMAISQISAPFLILAMSAILFGTIIKSNYSAVLVSSGVSLAATEYPITDRKSLGKALLSGKYRLVVLSTGSGMQNAGIRQTASIKKAVKDYGLITAYNYQETTKQIYESSQNLVTVGPSPGIENGCKQFKDLVCIRDTSRPVYKTVGLGHMSSLTESLNLISLTLRETGITQKIMEKYATVGQKIPKPTANELDMLSLTNMQTKLLPFLVAAYCIVCLRFLYEYRLSSEF